MNNARCPWNTATLAIYKKQQTLKLNRKRQQMMTLNCVWKLTGLVTQIIDTKDKYARPYWQVVVEVLAEEARDMRTTGRKRVIECRGDQHFDDRFTCATGESCIGISTIHVIE